MEKQLRLRAFEKEDAAALHRWMNDPESIRYTGRVPLSYEDVVRHAEGKKSNGDLVMAVESDAGELLGWIFLQDIEQEHGRAGIGILLAPEHRGNGYGTEAMKRMIDIGFKQLRLNRIYLTTRGFNERAIRTYAKLGFVAEGVLRKHAYVDGVYSDTVIMGLLAEEWPSTSQD